METVILKAQRPVVSSIDLPEHHVLVYNEDKSYMCELQSKKISSFFSSDEYKIFITAKLPRHNVHNSSCIEATAKRLYRKDF